MLHQHVGQQQGERFVADQFARAPDRVAETEWRLLAREACGSGPRQIARQRLEIGMALALVQGMLQLELAIEVILNDCLVTAGDEDEILDTGFARLVDHMLDQRPIDHRQHFLRHGLGGGQKSGAEAGDGEDSFANRFHAWGHSSDKPPDPTRDGVRNVAGELAP